MAYQSVSEMPEGLLSSYQKCVAIAHNLWWSWHPEVVEIFQLLNPQRWRELVHNPIALLREFTPEQFERRVLELALQTRINVAYRRQCSYVAERPMWARQHAGVLESRPVAYFSLEFGLHESVPIYSGGLGILAGDHVKSASGMGVPLVAIGLFYDKGYFKQLIDAQGNQVENYVNTEVENLPFEPALDAKGAPITVKVETKTGPIFAKVRCIRVGRVQLYLLDTDLDENSQDDRELTSTLYGGDARTRIRQELVCGVGGVRALRAMGITPGVYHLNEGHNSFATLEATRQKMEHCGLSFEEALRDTAQQTVFTTHTPVEAGHDYFPQELVEEHLEPLYTELGLDIDSFMALGRKDPEDKNEKFCMTILGMKASRYANAVSSLHGVVTRRMWHSLWPEKSEEEVPIGHITNGVHVPTWMATQLKTLFERTIPGWTEESIDPEVWSKVYDVDSGELWETHFALKTLLFDFARRRVARQLTRVGAPQDQIAAAARILNPNALTIGFARRFAEYKRAFLVAQDEERLDMIVNNPERPVQFIFAGKAHPADNIGKAVINRIVKIQRNPKFSNSVIFLEDYDINVARHLVQGVDVWMNNPRRPLEASGTSGQKAALNGALNFSILDGWWAEAYDGSNGFAIGDGASHVDVHVTDKRDNESLLEVLENKVVPMYYDRNEHGLPLRWIRYMKNSIATLAWRFSAHRMVADYVNYGYLPAAGGLSVKMPR
ncbi:MAG: alpha-glucan family phosphorylase [Planctomycetia bacterium]|nr:alpha-glucan family phosphorylase [Planctomycetia bacterium]